MIDYIKNETAKIHKYMDTRTGEICLLTGDEGIGKSTVAEKYCELYKNACILNFSDEFSLAESLCGNKYKKNYDKHSRIFSPLRKKIRNQHLKLIFFDICRNVHADVFDIIREIHMIIVSQKILVNIIILMDNQEYYNFQHCFLKFPQLIYLPSLNKWTYTDFLQLTNELYPQANISVEMIKLLAEYSIGNPSIFLWHIAHLKSLFLIRDNKGRYEIASLKEIKAILEEGYSDIVWEKYKALSPELQTVIKKTSSIGLYFHTKTLKEAFNIKNAKTVIDAIEKLSMLILYVDMERNTGRFISESAHTQIEELIESNQLKEWCKTLGEYLENRIGDATSIVEKIQFKEKCISYFAKSGNDERVIFHCLSLVPMKYSLSQYVSAVETVNTLKEFSKKSADYKRVNAYCYFLFAIIYKAMAKYEDALNNLNEFSRRSGSKSIYVVELEAELIYDLGDMEKSYDIFKEMYKSKSHIDDPYLRFDIVSMFSSIEETRGTSSYIKHFNQALSIAKENRIDIAYYKLLRKANIAHSGENGIRLMKEAETYFEKNKMLSELMMTQHNIGTEALFCEEAFNLSLKYLINARKIAEEMGFRELIYTKNSLAIYKILKGDYNVALEILEELSLEYEEDFSKLAVYLNQVTCLRILGRWEKAQEMFNIAKEINADDKNRFPFYAKQLVLQEAYFYLVKGSFQDAYVTLLYYLNHSYDDRVENTVAVKLVLSKLCKEKDFLVPSELSGFAGDSHYISHVLADSHLVLCELMFWE